MLVDTSVWIRALSGRQPYRAELDRLLGEEEVAEVVASHLLGAYRLDPDAADSESLRGEAYEALLRAGERAASLGATTEAQRYFEQTAELALDSRDQAAVLIRAGEMALRASELEPAERAFQRAMTLYEGSGDTHAAARASGWLAVVEANAGRRDEAIDRMERACAVIAGDEPDADLALLLTRLGQSYWFRGDMEQASERTERALDLAEALELPEILARGWNTRGMIISSRRPEEARGLFQLAFDKAMANELYSQAGGLLGQLSDLAFRRDRYVESIAHLEQMIPLTRRAGARGHEWFALSEMTHALTMLGRWDEALARFGELPEEQIGTDTQLLSPLTGPLDIYLHRGEVDQARKLFARYAGFDDLSGDVQAYGCYQAGKAAVRLAEGDPRGALTAAGIAFDTRASLGINAQNTKHGFMWALEAALLLGDRAKAEELLAIVEEQPPGRRAPWLDAIAERFRARLAGDDPGADRHFTAAGGQLRALELPFHLAVVQLEHGEWLAARGRPDDAQPLLAEARDTFEVLRAQPWLERVDAVAPGSAAEVSV